MHDELTVADLREVAKRARATLLDRVPDLHDASVGLDLSAYDETNGSRVGGEAPPLTAV